ncbi:hypothetical protein ACVME8_010590 [Bradyrhizobium diazoefficiens]
MPKEYSRIAQVGVAVVVAIFAIELFDHIAFYYEDSAIVVGFVMVFEMAAFMAVWALASLYFFLDESVCFENVAFLSVACWVLVIAQQTMQATLLPSLGTFFAIDEFSASKVFIVAGFLISLASIVVGSALARHSRSRS